VVVFLVLIGIAKEMTMGGVGDAHGSMDTIGVLKLFGF